MSKRQPKCLKCGEILDNDCMGRKRCPECDGPCPCCYDGGMGDEPEEDTQDNEESEYPDEPEKDDILSDDGITFRQSGRVVVQMWAGATDEETWSALDQHMIRSNYYPNVWIVSDHGNAHLMRRDNAGG